MTLRVLGTSVQPSAWLIVNDTRWLGGYRTFSFTGHQLENFHMEHQCGSGIIGSVLLA